MRRSKSLIFGLICGLLCVVCVGIYVGEVDRQAEEDGAAALARYGGDQIEVCIARRDIAPGEVVSESDVETRTWLVDLLPADAVSDASDVVGKQVSSTILEGEVVSKARLGAPSASLDIPDGLTAVSVPARDVQAVGGALSAGMRADVYAIGASSTAKLASRALIVATSATASDSGATVSWVTLAVAPETVEELVSAAQNLELYFVLPSEGNTEEDAADADETPADSASLSGTTTREEARDSSADLSASSDSSGSEGGSKSAGVSEGEGHRASSDDGGRAADAGAAKSADSEEG